MSKMPEPAYDLGKMSLHELTQLFGRRAAARDSGQVKWYWLIGIGFMSWLGGGVLTLLLFHLFSPEHKVVEPYIGAVGMLTGIATPLLVWRVSLKKSRSRTETLLNDVQLELNRRTSTENAQATSITRPQAEGSQPRVFLVHGHDDHALQRTARFLESLGLNVVVLREQPNRGRTIIEKLHDYKDVAAAVVLLTPDDVGGAKDEPTSAQRSRARQNVILELGFFLGALGRTRVVALYVHGVEVPSDYGGVIFIECDDNGGWKLTLFTELQASGLPLNPAKLRA